ncbi:MAG: GSCFA domain-containing protein, partial [Flavobacterium sp.]
MNFFTQFQIPKSNISIDYNSSLFLIGSCFAENIGNLLAENKFKTLTNPLGILFHPLAIERNLTEIIQNKKIDELDILFYNHQYLSLHSHSINNRDSKEKFVNNYNLLIEKSHLFLKNASHIMITYGTTWVYEYLKTNEIVANCHKLPSSDFKKKILDIDEIKNSIDNTIQILQEFNPTIKIIFTISPVRHLKDGFMENTLSKSLLICALYENIKYKNAIYSIFPAYEIMLDELRDYRFYNNDYLHPNPLAIEYIWEKFSNLYFSDNTKNTIKKLQKINKDLKHKS